MAKYLYNGIELPALPEWDKETYPYAAIIVHTKTITGTAYKYNLRCSTSPWSRNGTYYKNNGTAIESEYVLDDSTSWGEFSDLSTAAYAGDFIWTNTDILNDADGSVYLAASEPVPVGGEPEEPETPESPDSIIPADTYIKKGNKVYKVNGGGSTDIKTFDSVEEMNAANLPEGTIACVPSSGGGGGGGGLPVVELTTVINTEGVSFTEAENAMLDAIGDSLFILKGAVYVPLFEQQLMFECIPYKMTSDGSTYVFENFFGTVLMMSNEGQWIAQFKEKENVEIPV